MLKRHRNAITAVTLFALIYYPLLALAVLGPAR